MNTFLNLMASDMLGHFGADMRDVSVVFPSKRPGMFLSRELARLSDRPVWTPRYLTMGDLFQSLTDVRTADTLECVCQLYSVMQEVMGAEYTETLDDFWSWGEVLMADFNDIDKHMACAKAIFTNIADHERLKNIDYLDEHQRETLRRFFGAFSLENSTRLQERFLLTWSHMYEVYVKLHDRLLSAGKLWEGALFRHVAEQLQHDESLLAKLLDGKRAIVFAGFNVLSRTEHTMMSIIQREGKARFYWDYDISYADPKSEAEAGYFMRQNLRDFPSAITETDAFDGLSHLRDVTFVACTSDNAAARYVGTWAGAQGDNAVESQAIVLADEGLMQPVLHSVPEAIQDINVTMGFPISDTPVYGIVMALFKLQIEGYDEGRGRFRYPFEQTLRRQPLFNLLDEADCFAYQGQDSRRLLDYLRRHLQQIALHYARIEEPDILEQLYSEAVYRTDRMLGTLQSLFPNHSSLIPNPNTLRRLLRQMMTGTKIPFHSEPDRGLQVMGMLETRCLDFRRILLLSAEEGYLPSGSRGTSLIPESLREAFGMTTQRHRIAVFAYYFYRLLQRAEHITCVYNESTTDGVRHEMSRFLRQILAETDIPVRTLWLSSDREVKLSPPMQVEKTDKVVRLLRERYDQSLQGGQHIMLSPSAINAYICCPMQFYLDKVLRIRRDDDPEEGISADIIGNIFHDTAQFFYSWLTKHYGTNVVSKDMLAHTDVLESMLDTAFDVSWLRPTDDFDRLPEMQRRWHSSAPLTPNSTPPLKERTGQSPNEKGLPLKGGGGSEYKGTVLIAHDVLLRYLKELLRYDARHAPFRIIGAEEERSISFCVGNATVKVGGRIDRIDEMDGHLRIVDYKTGSREPDGVKMENVVSLTEKHERYYLQTFLYALAEAERGESALPIKPILFFPIKAGSEDYDPSLRLGGEVVDDFANQHAEVFKQGLQAILEDIFNPEKPFSCTTNTDNCKYCKLGLICGKR